LEIIERIGALRERVAGWRRDGVRVGFVPTMGNLHAGHIGLVTEAHRHSDRVIISIFVNPLQFGPTEDFAQYPRTLEQDREMLERTGADLLFHPPVPEMYPDGHQGTTLVDVHTLSKVLCGHFRPGHFEGVATVVTKLFNIVQPDVAVFGEKDYQQLTIIRQLVNDLCIPVEIVGVPTMRDPDGLALSSRNRYLTPAERKIAPHLYETLLAIRNGIESGDRHYESIEKAGMQALERAGFKPDYVAIRRADNLHVPTDAARELVILAAARLGKARLIDNVRASRPDDNVRTARPD
jgi:pantoate--beta-alanine ligase